MADPKKPVVKDTVVTESIKADILLGQGFANAAAELAALSLPIKTSYWISKNLKAIQKEMEILNETKNKLLIKHAKKGKDGELLEANGPDGKPQRGTVQIENTDKYMEEFKQLGDTDVEVKIKKLSLGDLGSVNIKPQLLLNLDIFFTE